MRKTTPVIGLIAAAALLTGCGSSSPETKESVSETQAGGTQEQGANEPSSQGGFSIDSITSCDQVEALVKPYIEGLVPQADNGVDEWGASCGWETAEGELNLDNIRLVQVVVSPVDAGTDRPDTSLIEQLEGGSVVPDSWVEKNGGVAYSLELGTAVAGAISTVVWLPGVEVTVAGGSWSNVPTLDGPAAIDLTKGLLAK